MEVEAKFTVTDEAAFAGLETAEELAGYTIEPGEVRSDRDTFLDTPGRAFLEAGYYLRRRETGGGVRLALKQLAESADGVLRREELEALVAADVPVSEWPAGALRERVEEVAGGEPLEPFLTIAQVRHARRVARRAVEIAELSLDRVTVSAPEGERHWLEIEVETRGAGGEDDLAALVAALRGEPGLEPEGRSKFARALEIATEAVAGADDDAGRLLGSERPLHEHFVALEGALGRRARALLALDDGLSQADAGIQAGLSARRVRYWLARYRREGAAVYGAAAEAAPSPDAAAAASVAVEGAEAAPPAAPAPRSRRPDILAGDTMTAAAVKTLRFHLERMLEHEEGTRLCEDPEELHDMRVSTRRMRMALRVFADHLDPDVMRPVLKGLRRTGRTLGAVRDLDVFHEKTQAYLDGLAGAGDLDGLLSAWAGERERQREHLVAYLDGRRYRAFVDDLAALLDGPLEHLAASAWGAPRPERVAQVLPGVLYRDLGVVWAFEGQLGGLETPLPRFHALRKACKGLRYTLEFFEGVLGPGAKPLIKKVKGMQDHLGDLQDAVVTCGILRDYLTWGTWRHQGHDLPGPLEVVVAPGAARYLAARQEEMEHLVLTFPEVWPGVAGQEFGRNLATMIATI